MSVIKKWKGRVKEEPKEEEEEEQAMMHYLRGLAKLDPLRTFDKGTSWRNWRKIMRNPK